MSRPSKSYVPCDACNSPVAILDDEWSDGAAYFCNKCASRMSVGPFPDAYVGGAPIKWLEDSLQDQLR